MFLLSPSTNPITRLGYHLALVRSSAASTIRSGSVALAVKPLPLMCWHAKRERRITFTDTPANRLCSPRKVVKFSFTYQYWLSRKRLHCRQLYVLRESKWLAHCTARDFFPDGRNR